MGVAAKQGPKIKLYLNARQDGHNLAYLREKQLHQLYLNCVTKLFEKLIIKRYYSKGPYFILGLGGNNFQYLVGSKLMFFGGMNCIFF